MGLQGGQLLHVSNTMKLFNDCWDSISRKAITKCRVNRESIGASHLVYLKSVLHNHTANIDVDIDLTDSNYVSKDGENKEEHRMITFSSYVK